MNTGTALAYQIPDAARRLGIGRTLLYDLIKTGKLRAIKIKTRTVISDQELRRFVAEAESDATSVKT